MDTSRSLLLGVLVLFCACASWTPHAQFEEPNTPVPLVADAPVGVRCSEAPHLRPTADSVVVLGACEDVVALYRRDVLAGGDSELLGSCAIPCTDTPGPGFFAYATAALRPDGVGPTSIETFVSVE